MPIQSSLTTTLPASGRTEENYQPFAYDLPTIEGVKNEIEVLGSLQRPKKVTLLDNKVCGCVLCFVFYVLGLFGVCVRIVNN